MAVIDNQLLGKLRNIAAFLAHCFVEREELIKLLLLSWISRENLLIVGPTGSAKSELAHTASACLHGRFFEILLTRFTEPQELFGPLNVQAFQQGKYCHIGEGKLPEADIAFFDEIFNANSAILNTLLSVLNERCYYDGNVKIPLPLLSAVAATMTVSDEPTLRHLFDRFLLRIKVKAVSPARENDLLRKGWNQEKQRQNRKTLPPNPDNTLTIAHITHIGQWILQIDPDPIRPQYRDLVHDLRAGGIEISDRRFVKLQKLLAASAIYHGNEQITVMDLWILKHVWNREEQIPLLEKLVDRFIEEHQQSVPEQSRTAYRSHNLIKIKDIEQAIANLRAGDQQDSFIRDCEQIKQQILVLPADKQAELLNRLDQKRQQIMGAKGWPC